MAAKYISLGIIVDDIRFPDGQTHWGVLGGGGPQTAWGMALAAQSGQEVGLVAGVGTDFDNRALAPLEAMGVDLSGVYTTDLPTPRAWQYLAADGSRQHVWQVDQATSDLQTHPDWETIAHFYPHPQVVHWGIHPEDAYLAICPPLREQNALISIEPFKGLEEPLPDEDLRAVLTQCDIYSPTWGEAVSIFGTTDRQGLLCRCRSLGGHILALRRGAQGAEIWDLLTGDGVRVPAAPTRGVVDPVGAGDAFCGAFAVTLHRSGDLMEAAVLASVAASYLVEQVGLPPAPPADEDVQQRKRAVQAKAQHLSLQSPVKDR